jgi:hypothetical protein
MENLHECKNIFINISNNISQTRIEAKLFQKTLNINKNLFWSCNIFPWAFGLCGLFTTYERTAPNCYAAFIFMNSCTQGVTKILK